MVSGRAPGGSVNEPSFRPLTSFIGFAGGGWHPFKQSLRARAGESESHRANDGDQPVEINESSHSGLRMGFTLHFSLGHFTGDDATSGRRLPRGGFRPGSPFLDRLSARLDEAFAAVGFVDERFDDAVEFADFLFA